MQIKNSTKQKTLSKDILFLKTEQQRMKGLIGEKKPKTVMFETRFGIHTFLMKFPLDIIILDTNMKIVALTKSLKPNRIFLWNPKYKIVIELPDGTIKKTKTALGDSLTIEQ